MSQTIEKCIKCNGKISRIKRYRIVNIHSEEIESIITILSCPCGYSNENLGEEI